MVVACRIQRIFTRDERAFWLMTLHWAGGCGWEEGVETGMFGVVVEVGAREG